MEPLHLSSLSSGLLWRHADKLPRQVLAVTLERVPAHKEISSVVINGDLEWVRRQSPYVLSQIKALLAAMQADWAHGTIREVNLRLPLLP